MTYRASKKAKKLWSEQANAKQARERLSGPARSVAEDVDRSIFITVSRPGTGEHVEFQLLEGSRINNYSVYCSGKHIGIMGITRVMSGIRKALPAFRRMD